MTTNKVLIRAPEAPERRAAASMTGRYLLTFEPRAQREISAKLNRAGFKAATPLPRGAMSAKALPDGSHLGLRHVGIALVDPKPRQEDALQSMAAQERAILALEPERIVRAVATENIGDYVRGWRDAVDALAEKIIEVRPARAPTPQELAVAPATWGLMATRVVNSRLSGANIKVAVLDTGFDLTHPDFARRQIVTKNFVGDQQPFHDGVGHGTHCIGTATGPLRPATGPRYGIGYDATIYAGRVLDDTGRGGDFNILQGIDWAIEQGCEVISLSLGAPWLPGDPPFNTAYESAAQRALAAGCLLVVAAGNEADNPQYVGAVGTPGNSPSVLTVAAIDRQMNTASFSNRTQPAAPGVKGPDLAAPGVDIYSSWPVSSGSYNTISGTSMATPHVAGIAALFAGANSGLRGQALKDAILGACAALPDGVARRGEIGRGLVQAPADSIANQRSARRPRRGRRARG
ncbi:MAG TPA: S8 family serine peptidase [Pseudolabrys sp.]|jgi:subtilisin family serine protease|nr:S8 family serine peptidase [Pseudolabrys sp.]